MDPPRVVLRLDGCTVIILPDEPTPDQSADPKTEPDQS